MTATLNLTQAARHIGMPRNLFAASVKAGRIVPWYWTDSGRPIFTDTYLDELMLQQARVNAERAS